MNVGERGQQDEEENEKERGSGQQRKENSAERLRELSLAIDPQPSPFDSPSRTGIRVCVSQALARSPLLSALTVHHAAQAPRQDQTARALCELQRLTTTPSARPPCDASCAVCLPLNRCPTGSHSRRARQVKSASTRHIELCTHLPACLVVRDDSADCLCLSHMPSWMQREPAARQQRLHARATRRQADSEWTSHSDPRRTCPPLGRSRTLHPATLTSRHRRLSPLLPRRCSAHRLTRHHRLALRALHSAARSVPFADACRRLSALPRHRLGQWLPHSMPGSISGRQCSSVGCGACRGASGGGE